MKKEAKRRGELQEKQKANIQRKYKKILTEKKKKRKSCECNTRYVVIRFGELEGSKTRTDGDHLFLQRITRSYLRRTRRRQYVRCLSDAGAELSSYQLCLNPCA